MIEDALAAVHAYHDATKHHFHRFARSLGYLDWASQPRPFRQFTGAPSFPLYPAPGANRVGYVPRPMTFAALSAPEPGRDTPARSLSAALIGDIIRHALGLSAWKRYHDSRWSLRVNPSSGNLHPTEAYVVCRALPGLADVPAVYHYAADHHALERRCEFDADQWHRAVDGRQDVLLVALTSIHWRESWKYGERAFRYCQHDIGHAVAAISFAASLVGWRASLQSGCSHQGIASITGIDRKADFADAEPEEAGCLLALSPGEPLDFSVESMSALAEAVMRGRWTGQASQLSEREVAWEIIDEIARATVDPGRAGLPTLSPPARPDRIGPPRDTDARALLLQRRSAVAFDGRSTMARADFLSMLSRVMPGSGPPWNSLWWSPRVHLVLFVHRVEDVEPGLYMLLRDPQIVDRLRSACRDAFIWEVADDRLPLWLLAPLDTRTPAARLSCDQSIAADGFFSLGMISDFDASLGAFGPSFYRHLFWECGMVGQVLYLQAEAAGARGTGIGCFYDDAVHDTLGLSGHGFQSLYHFTVGQPVDDGRLTTEPGYPWEGRDGSSASAVAT